MSGLASNVSLHGLEIRQSTVAELGVGSRCLLARPRGPFLESGFLPFPYHLQNGLRQTGEAVCPSPVGEEEALEPWKHG